MLKFDKAFIKVDGEIVELPIGNCSSAAGSAQYWQAVYTADSDMPSGSTIEIPEGIYDPATDLLTINQEGFILIQNFQYTEANNVITLNLDIPSGTNVSVTVLKLNGKFEAPEPPEPELAPDYTEDEVPYTDPTRITGTTSMVNGSSGFSKTLTSIQSNIEYASYHTSSKKYGINYAVETDNYPNAFNVFIKMYSNVTSTLNFFGYDDVLPDSVVDASGLEKYRLGSNLVKSATVYNVSPYNNALVYQPISKRGHFVITGSSSFELLHLVLKKSMFTSALTSSILPKFKLATVANSGGFIDVNPLKNFAFATSNSMFDSGDSVSFMARNRSSDKGTINLNCTAINKARFLFFTKVSYQYIAGNNWCGSSGEVIWLSIDPSA